MGLIPLEFDSGKTKLIAMPPIIASSRFPDKPKLLDRAQDGESLECLSGLRRRSNGYSWRRRRTLVLRAAKAEDRPENDSQKSEANSEARTFTEAFRHIDGENNSHDDINERDEHQKNPPAGSADDLAPNIEIVDRDDAGPTRLPSFGEYFPHRNDQ